MLKKVEAYSLIGVIASWIIVALRPKPTHDVDAWAIILNTNISMVYLYILFYLSISAIFYLDAFHNVKGLFILGLASFPLIEFGVLRQVTGLTCLVIYAWALKKQYKWAWIFCLASLSHLFSGIFSVIYALMNKQKAGYYTLLAVPILALAGIFSYGKLSYIFSYFDLSSMDQASISIRLTVSIVILVVLSRG